MKVMWRDRKAPISHCCFQGQGWTLKNEERLSSTLRKQSWPNTNSLTEQVPVCCLSKGVCHHVIHRKLSLLWWWWWWLYPLSECDVLSCCSLWTWLMHTSTQHDNDSCTGSDVLFIYVLKNKHYTVMLLIVFPHFKDVCNVMAMSNVNTTSLWHFIFAFLVRHVKERPKTTSHVTFCQPFLHFQVLVQPGHIT